MLGQSLANGAQYRLCDVSKMTTRMTTTPDGRLGSTANEQPLLDEFGELRHLLSCDNPSCDAKGPTIHCERCKEQYYCSVHCQKAHWNTGGHKHSCSSFEARGAAWVASMSSSPTVTEPLGSVDLTLVTPGSKSGPIVSSVKACCGICLEAIASPVILVVAMCFVSPVLPIFKDV
jgi:MYND finger